ncbi:hypothetical protein D3C83_236060 [compost metagenome]
MKWTRTPEAVAAIRQQRQELEQAAALAKIGVDASTGIKNVADANKSMAGVNGGA